MTFSSVESRAGAALSVWKVEGQCGRAPLPPKRMVGEEVRVGEGRAGSRT